MQCLTLGRRNGTKVSLYCMVMQHSSMSCMPLETKLFQISKSPLYLKHLLVKLMPRHYWSADKVALLARAWNASLFLILNVKSAKQRIWEIFWICQISKKLRSEQLRRKTLLSSPQLSDHIFTFNSNTLKPRRMTRDFFFLRWKWLNCVVD